MSITLSNRQTIVQNVSPDVCRISRYNSRKTRDVEDIQILAERLSRNGFELTRALWAYMAEDGVYEVFAGGTRLEAAKLSGVNVDIVVHEGYSWEEISRLSDQDNENDEYHKPVPITDMWAEYARLSTEEGWTQQQIADAKGVQRTLVTERIGWNKYPDDIKEVVSTGDLTERHLREVSGECLPVDILKPWANWEEWRLNLLREAAEDPKKWTSSRVKTHWDRFKETVKHANELVQTLPEEAADEYIFEKGLLVRKDINWQEVFAGHLLDTKASSISAVDSTFGVTVKRMKESNQRKADYDAKISNEQACALEKEREIENFRSRCKILVGDVLEKLQELEPDSVDLIITSPPYNLGSGSWPMGGAGRSPRYSGIGYADNTDEIQYQAWQLGVIKGLYRVAKPGASFFYNHKVRQIEGTVIHPLDWLRDESNPWILRQEIVWDRGSTHNHTPTLFDPQDERIYWFTKGTPVISEKGIKFGSVLRLHGPVANTWHPAPFTEELPRVLIQSVGLPNMVVLDPFAGSCTTLRIALESGCSAVGIDISSEYIKQAIEENQWPILIN